MDFLINPNVSYTLLVLGIMLAALALFAPGTGLLEIGALFLLVLAGYGIANMPVNVWAVALIMLGAIPFGLGLVKRLPRKYRALLMLASMTIFLVGSALLYHGENGPTAVDWILLVILWPLALILTWFIVVKGLEATDSRPAFSPDQLIGMTGRASSDIRGQGTVYVNGEEWSAISSTFIPTGSTIRVLNRNGLTLEVDLVES
jgi:membrane-bound ClpP family serine protease